MKSALDPRHQRRQKIIQELFAWTTLNHARQRLGSGQQTKARNPKSNDQKTQEIIKQREEIDKLIAAAAPEWGIERINPVDLAILRLGAYELVWERTEPPKVIIDEAVELAKEFGGEAAPSFVNGALAKILFSPARLRRIIADRLGVEETRLIPEAHFLTDLNIPDLEIADLITTLEQELNITFEKDRLFATIGELLEYIEDQSD